MRADLLALGLRQRLGRAHHLFHRRGGEIDALGLGEIGKMQREARHADEHGGLQRLDQLELRRRTARRCRRRPSSCRHRTNARCAPRPGRPDECRSGTRCDRGRPCRSPCRETSGPRSSKPVGDVVGGARIEDRLAGRAAGAPEFRDLGMRHRAELLMKLAWSNLRRMSLSRIGIFCHTRRIVEPDRRRSGRACRDTRAASWRARRRCACARSGSP